MALTHESPEPASSQDRAALPNSTIFMTQRSWRRIAAKSSFKRLPTPIHESR